MLDVCRATKQQGKYLPPSNNTEVNIVSVYIPNQWIASIKQFLFLRKEAKECAQNQEKCREVISRYYPEFK